MSKPDSVRVTTFVAVDPDAAFEVFTRETDLWWKQGPRFRFGARRVGVLGFEGGEGGRLTERFDDGPAFDIGTVLTWEPGARLVFEWRARNFAPDQKTVVEVRFVPKNGGTEVVLEHRGWAVLPDEHPARHGHTGRAFADMLGLWWGELLTSYRVHAGPR